MLGLFCVQAFVRAAEKHGRGELEKIAGDIEGKTKDEVIAYSKVGLVICRNSAAHREPLPVHTSRSLYAGPQCTTCGSELGAWLGQRCHCAALGSALHLCMSCLHVFVSLQVFWQRYQELPDWEKVIKNIERGEQKIQRQADIMQAVRTKLERYKNPWQELKVGTQDLHQPGCSAAGTWKYWSLLTGGRFDACGTVRDGCLLPAVNANLGSKSAGKTLALAHDALCKHSGGSAFASMAASPGLYTGTVVLSCLLLCAQINYGANKGKAYTEEEDRFIVCSIAKHGYGAWDELKADIRGHWRFRWGHRACAVQLLRMYQCA